MSSSSSGPPVSLGKPSLRHRLESYYSLVAPDAIADKDEWARKFEIIYNKYGGCHDKETKLANKLANKYGNQVRLLVAPPHRSQRQKAPSANHQSAALTNKLHDEQHYTLEDHRINSKILDFTSPKFDPFHALSAPERIVTEANPSIFLSSSSSASQKLDNISKFRALLPTCDPQRIEPKSKATQKRKTTDKNNEEQTDDKQKKQQQQQQTRVPMFLSMVSKYEHKSSGPLSLLYSILQNRQRVRVMVRYVDCIRGTLTGYLVAFDKHFNMILKDVDEVYGSRVTQDAAAVEVATGGGSGQQNNGEAASAPSKSTLEAQRRRCYPKDGSGGPGPAVKQRYFNQLMIRGDNVVMVWRAEAERSMHPQTKKSPVSSASSNSKSEPTIGTPGSLYFALQRWEMQQKKRRS